MTLGEKLKQARLKKGLTQTQVAGDRITRNMLSQIETGAASPSVKTLEYLAEVLEVSVNWLLGSGDEELADQARAFYSAGDYGACLVLLEPEAENLLQECRLMLCRSALQCGFGALEEGDFARGRRLGVLAGNLAQNCLYAGAQERAETELILARCALEEGETVRPEELRVLPSATGLEDRVQLLLARYYLAVQQPEQAGRALDTVSVGMPGGSEYRFLRGSLEALRNNWTDARRWLRQAEQGKLSQPDRQELYRLMECCAREQEDYREAYLYASLRLQEHR